MQGGILQALEGGRALTLRCFLWSTSPARLRGTLVSLARSGRLAAPAVTPRDVRVPIRGLALTIALARCAKELNAHAPPQTTSDRSAKLGSARHREPRAQDLLGGGAE